ncbi:hypothetical protein SAMN02745866_02026 [Alteromonadaceae bacterium Bs31]|nr:hypothetical protein SAMN02745866_02026 [Alteromonadaceae bacterium Bs31]
MKHAKPFSIIAPLCAISLLVASTVTADTVRLPQTPSAEQFGNEQWNVPIPLKGMSKATVEKKFGAPSSRHGPKGEPPIYFWEYKEFTVYFESDYVLHAVRKYRPE